MSEQQSRDAAPFDQDIELRLESYFPFLTRLTGREAAVGAVEGEALAAIESEHKYRIFQRNVRYYLKATQKVNRSIANAISVRNAAKFLVLQQWHCHCLQQVLPQRAV